MTQITIYSFAKQAQLLTETQVCIKPRLFLPH